LRKNRANAGNTRAGNPQSPPHPLEIARFFSLFLRSKKRQFLPSDDAANVKTKTTPPKLQTHAKRWPSRKHTTRPPSPPGSHVSRVGTVLAQVSCHLFLARRLLRPVGTALAGARFHAKSAGRLARRLLRRGLARRLLVRDSILAEQLVAGDVALAEQLVAGVGAFRKECLTFVRTRRILGCDAALAEQLVAGDAGVAQINATWRVCAMRKQGQFVAWSGILPWNIREGGGDVLVWNFGSARIARWSMN